MYRSHKYAYVQNQGYTLLNNRPLKRIIARAHIVCSSLIIVFMCSSCYLMKQGANLIKYQVRSKSIDRLVRDSTLSKEKRTFFDEVARIRSYAFDSIGLERNKNYTKFVSVDSSYLMAMLSAADSASFDTKKWCYPFMGCFPLRSYYSIEDAQRAGRRLVKKGYEINIDKIDGFSTLGFFSDPLYSFMIDRSIFSTAQYIFHELTHVTVYYKNVQFSEELASFIGQEGALSYLRTYYGSDSPEYRQAEQFIVDQKTYLQLLRDLYTALGKVYEQNIPRHEKLKRKNEIITTFKKRLIDEYDSIFTTEIYRGVETLSFNNAFLAVRMTYSLNLELFDKFYRQRGNNLREVIDFAVGLKKQKRDPNELLEEAVGK